MVQPEFRDHRGIGRRHMRASIPRPLHKLCVYTHHNLLYGYLKRNRWLAKQPRLCGTDERESDAPPRELVSVQAERGGAVPFRMDKEDETQMN